MNTMIVGIFMKKALGRNITCHHAAFEQWYWGISRFGAWDLLYVHIHGSLIACLWLLLLGDLEVRINVVDFDDHQQAKGIRIKPSLSMFGTQTNTA